MIKATLKILNSRLEFSEIPKCIPGRKYSGS